MFNFIWDQKPDKINRKILCQNYNNGGLKMLDFKKFALSLKASWVKRILDKDNNGQWKIIYLNKLKNYGGELLFECNCTKNEINNMFKNDTFLHDILTSWFTIKTADVDLAAINIKTEIVWNNSLFKIANKTVFFKTWFERGIKYIHDFYNPQTRQWYNFIDLINIYNLPPSDFLNFMSLISCLRTTCKQNMEAQLNVANNKNSNTIFDKITKTKQANKLFYLQQLNNDKP